jgi:glycosyl transferase family 25
VKVFVINLKDAIERRASAELQLSKLKMDYEIFEAIDQNDDLSTHFTSINYFLYLVETNFLPSKGEIACYASHLALWKRCVSIGEPITILEDDFLASEGLKDALEFIEPYGNELGFIRLEAISHTKMHQNKYSEPAYKDDGRFSLHSVKGFIPIHLTGYTISPKVAQHFINKSKSVSMPVDWLPKRNWAYGNGFYALNPPVISLSEHAIQSSITGRKKLPIRHFIKPFRIINRYYWRYLAHRQHAKRK